MGIWKTALDVDIDNTIVKSEGEVKYLTKADEGKVRLDLVPTSLMSVSYTHLTLPTKRIV